MFLRKLELGLVSLFFIALLAGCGSGNKASGKYFSFTNKFSIQLPIGWRSIDPRDGALVSVESPDRIVTIHVSANKVQSGYTNEKALQRLSAHGQISDMFYSESGDALVGGAPGHWLKGISGNQNFTSILYFVIRFNRLYSVQFIAPTGQFDNYDVQFDSIIQSFKFE